MDSLEKPKDDLSLNDLFEFHKLESIEDKSDTIGEFSIQNNKVIVKFGFEKNTFDTTAKEHYNEKDTGKPPVSSVGVKTKNSGHNFIYGYAKPTYTTTVGSTYQVHDVRDSFKIASLIKEKGEKFKQTSF